jgi:hypothetical protein
MQTDATELEVTARPMPEGSCVTDEVMNEIANALVVKENPAAESDTQMKVADEVDNLSSIGSDGGIYTKAVATYADDQPWIAGTTSELDFTGWSPSVDPTQCMWRAWFIPNAAETGIEVKKDPSDTAFVRPSLEISSITKDHIKVKMYNLTLDAQVYVRIEQSPLPPEQA